MNEMIVCLNGSFLPVKDAYLHLSDRGFLYGDGVFETIRGYNGKAFRLEEHINRLLDAAEFLTIPIDLNIAKIAKLTEKIVLKNNLKDFYLRITLTRGRGNFRFGEPSEKGNYTIVIVAKPYAGYPVEKYETGFSIRPVSFKRSPSSPITRYKTLNFLENTLAARETKLSGADEGIFINTDGYITEGTGSNIFIVKDGILKTPALECGLLPGILRKTVLELAQSNEITSKEAFLTIDDVIAADEVFLTNSLMEIMPVSELIIDQQAMPSDKNSYGRDMIMLLQREYKKLVNGI